MAPVTMRFRLPKILFCVTAGLILCGKCPGETGAPSFRLHLEESAFADTPNHVDWHTQPAQGWYVKEHCHASGYALAVCDEQSVGAKAWFRVGRELPPGTYDVWVRHVRMRRGGVNRLGVSLGNGLENGFTASATGQMAWEDRDGPRDYRWAKVTLTTTAPSSVVQIQALAIERAAIGDVPEYPLKTILLDALEITNRLDLVQHVPPGGRSGLLLTPQEAEECKTRETGKPAQKEETKPPLVSGPVRKGNLVRCGGFETGGQPFWFIWKSETTGYWLSPSDFDDQARGEGTRSLRLRGCADPYRREGEPWQFAVTLSSEPLKLRPHRKYVFSFYARRDDPSATLKAGVVLGPKGVRPAVVRSYCALSPELSEDWQRFSANFEFHDEQEPAQVWFQASGFGGDSDADYRSKGAVFLDAVQVEEGDLTDFAPGQPAEVALFSDCFRLYYYPETITFLARAARHDSRTQVVVPYEVRDLGLETVLAGQWVIPFNGSRTVDMPVRLDLKRRGAYLLTYRLKGVPGSEASLDIGIIDPPKADSPTSLGIYSGYGPTNMRYFQRAGARYYLTLCDTMFRGYRVAGAAPEGVKTKLPEQQALDLVNRNAYVWFDDLLERIESHGMKVIPELLYYEMPAWAGGGETDLSVWKAHVRKVVEHYAANKSLHLDTWNTGDEVREDYLGVHAAACEAIRSVQPNAKIMLSTCGGVLEHFIGKAGSPVMDATGGSWLSIPKWEYLNLRKISADYRLPFWNIGVGWGSKPIYRGAEAVAYNLRRGRFNPVSNLLFCQAILGPQIWCTYTNRYTRGESYGTNDYLTGTFVPHGLYFAGTVAFLQDALPGGEIELEHASGLEAVHFSKAGRTWAVVSPSQACFGELRVADGFDLEIDLSPSSIRTYDVDLSPVETQGRKSIRHRLKPYQLLLLEDVSAGKDALIDAVRRLRATPYRYATHRFLPNPETGGLDLGIQLFDSSARGGEGTFELGAQVPVMEGTPRVVPAKFGRGRSETVRLPLDPVLGTSRPIGNLIVDYVYRLNGQALFANSPHLWCMVSKGGKESLGRAGTADPSAWGASSLGGFLFVTQRYGGSYHTQQARRGAQRYLFSGPEDASARIYSRWDTASIRLAFDVQDDSLKTGGDCLWLYFDTAQDRSTGHEAPRKDVFEVQVLPDFDATACRATLTGLRLPLAAVLRRTAGGYFLQLDVPWASLNRFSPQKARTLGFNAVLVDQDEGQPEPTEIVFSAMPTFPPSDPRGFAQMVLLEER